MRAPKCLNTVFVETRVEFSLVYSKSRCETDQSSSKDSSKKSRNQESADASDENSSPHLCSNPNAVDLVYRAVMTYILAVSLCRIQVVIFSHLLYILHSNIFVPLHC